MFTPIETTAGAILLHLSTTTFLFDAGAILGASGFLRRLFRNPRDEITQQTPTLWFFVGIALAATFTIKFLPNAVPTYPSLGWSVASALQTTASGILTGWGTKVSFQHYHTRGPVPSRKLIDLALRWLYIRTHAVRHWTA